LIEAIVANDEKLMNDYLEGNEPSLDVLKKATLRKAVINNDIFPVFAGSALKNKGVQLVLDAVVDYLPSPLDIPAITGINPDNDEPIDRPASDTQPFAALAFKVATDPFVGQLYSLEFTQEH
jgi:elongation factor G